MALTQQTGARPLMVFLLPAPPGLGADPARHLAAVRSCVASTMKRDVAFKPQFHQLITDIQLAAVLPETTEKAGRNDACFIALRGLMAGLILVVLALVC